MILFKFGCRTDLQSLKISPAVFSERGSPTHPSGAQMVVHAVNVAHGYQLTHTEFKLHVGTANVSDSQETSWLVGPRGRHSRLCQNTKGLLTREDGRTGWSFTRGGCNLNF